MVVAGPEGSSRSIHSTVVRTANTTLVKMYYDPCWTYRSEVISGLRGLHQVIIVWELERALQLAVPSFKQLGQSGNNKRGITIESYNVF